MSTEWRFGLNMRIRHKFFLLKRSWSLGINISYLNLVSLKTVTINIDLLIGGVTVTISFGKVVKAFM